jgi:hypothetical protein
VLNLGNGCLCWVSISWRYLHFAGLVKVSATLCELRVRESSWVTLHSKFCIRNGNGGQDVTCQRATWRLYTKAVTETLVPRQHRKRQDVEGWIRVWEREMKDEEAYQCKTSVSYMCLLKGEFLFVLSLFMFVRYIWSSTQIALQITLSQNQRWIALRRGNFPVIHGSDEKDSSSFMNYILVLLGCHLRQTSYLSREVEW